MLDREMIENLYNQNPYNTVRIIQNRSEPGDSDNRDRHKRAARLFEKWIDEKRIVRDAEPGFYLYKQVFSVKTGEAFSEHVRTGIVVLVRLAEYADGVVQPHEYTLSGPKQDRYELLEETRCNTGMIFGIVPDDGTLYNAILETEPSFPVGEFTDSNQVRHFLSRNSDERIFKRLKEMISGRTILIADGHHRYETALAYARNTQSPESGHVMMTLVSMSDPGLVIRPFHRLVKKNTLSRKFSSVKDLSRYFVVEDIGGADSDNLSKFLKRELDFEMLFLDGSDRHFYGLKINQNGVEHLRFNPEGMSDMWNDLNVSKINRLVVAGIMEQPLDGTVLHDVMDYVNDAEAAFKRAMNDDGMYTGAFFIHPIDISTVKEIVSLNERMPQKSTNFYPKVYSGLVFNRLEKA